VIFKDTPIECYQGVYVKREDLCAPSGAPPFSKARGLVKHLTGLYERGYEGVAYVETSISMAGWGVAWACNLLGLECLIFNPIYKTPQPLLEYHRQQWRYWGAQLRDVPAGRAKVNFYASRQKIPKTHCLLPLGLPLMETLSETRVVAEGCIRDFSTIVISVGSGTIAAGVYQATNPNQTLYGVMCRSGNIQNKMNQIMGSTLFPSATKARLKLIDDGWEYSQACKIKPPFPCHPYYDAKAWEWLQNNKERLTPPILFWNIGSTGDFNLELLQ